MVCDIDILKKPYYMAHLLLYEEFVSYHSRNSGLKRSITHKGLQGRIHHFSKGNRASLQTSSASDLSL